MFSLEYSDTHPLLEEISRLHSRLTNTFVFHSLLR